MLTSVSNYCKRTAIDANFRKRRFEREKTILNLLSKLWYISAIGEKKLRNNTTNEISSRSYISRLECLANVGELK